MGKKFIEASKPKPFKDLVPGTHLRRSVKGFQEDQEVKPPEPTAAETALENRQREEIARLDDEENVRLKRGLRGRLGTRMLASRRTAGRTSMLGGATAARGGGGGSAAPSGGGGGTSGSPAARGYRGARP